MKLRRSAAFTNVARAFAVRSAAILGVVALHSGCAPAEAPRVASASTSSAVAPTSAAPASTEEDAELDRVAAIHGAPGPWAVAGYRMGRYALGKLGLTAGSFDLEITHHTPRQVMYSCIADGAAAATGASAGKLNLQLVDASADDVATTYRRKSTGQTITLRPSARFRARFLDTPREHARDFGREVLRLAAGDVFEEVAPRP